MGQHHDHDGEVEIHDRGLAFDLSTLMERAHHAPAARRDGPARRRRLRRRSRVRVEHHGGRCHDSPPAERASSAAAGEVCADIPEETAGPFPGDGSNGPNILTESGIVRSDITPSFGSSTTVAEGVPLTVRLALQDAANGCAPLAGAAVYLWHCDREGRYSMYSDGVTEENYLRGVQEADADGMVTFTSIFPACYQGRWPHIHFEVYPSLAEATAAGTLLATSQLAFPERHQQRGLRHRRLRAEREQHGRRVPRVRHGLRRRGRPAAGHHGRASSPKASPSTSPSRSEPPIRLGPKPVGYLPRLICRARRFPHGRSARLRSGVAQLAERRTVNPKVEGSSPSPGAYGSPETLAEQGFPVVSSVHVNGRLGPIPTPIRSWRGTGAAQDRSRDFATHGLGSTTATSAPFSQHFRKDPSTLTPLNGVSFGWTNMTRHAILAL